MSSNTTKKPENMADFFNVRADSYDNHMKENVPSFDELYDKVSYPIEKTDKEIKVLDLGCGTGLELNGILNKSPNALITGIDLSIEMLNLLKEKYKKYINQLTLINDSYLSYPLGENIYDYVVSVMTMHHWLENEKLNLYKKIHLSLKKNGMYIEGDYVVSENEANEMLEEYYREKKLIDDNNFYHLDIPMTEEKQIKLLKKAGFKEVLIIHKVEGNRVFVAKK